MSNFLYNMPLMNFFIPYTLNCLLPQHMEGMIQIYTHLSIQASWNDLGDDLMDTAGQDLGSCQQRWLLQRKTNNRSAAGSSLQYHDTAVTMMYRLRSGHMTPDVSVTTIIVTGGMSPFWPMRGQCHHMLTNQRPWYDDNWSLWPMAKSPSPSCVKKPLVTWR